MEGWNNVSRPWSDIGDNVGVHRKVVDAKSWFVRGVVGWNTTVVVGSTMVPVVAVGGVVIVADKGYRTHG